MSLYPNSIFSCRCAISIAQLFLFVVTTGCGIQEEDAINRRLTMQPKLEHVPLPGPHELRSGPDDFGSDSRGTEFWIDCLNCNDPLLKSKACDMLRVYGSDALPALAKVALDDPAIRGYALDSLAAIGEIPDDLQRVILLIPSRNGFESYHWTDIIEVLARTQNTLPEARAMCEQVVNDSRLSVTTRFRAALILNRANESDLKQGKLTREDFDKRRQLLAHRIYGQRGTVSLALIRPNVIPSEEVLLAVSLFHPDSLPTLQSVLTKLPNNYDCSAIGMAFGAHGDAGLNALLAHDYAKNPFLMQAWRDAAPWLPDESVRTVLDELQKPEANTRRRIHLLDLLGAFGHRARKAVDIVTPLLLAEDLHMSAWRCIARIADTRSEKVGQSVGKAFLATELKDLADVLDAIARLGVCDSKAKDKLLQLAKSGDSGERRAAFYAILSVSGRDRSLESIFVQNISHEDKYVREAALVCLYAVRVNRPETVAVICDALGRKKGPDEDVLRAVLCLSTVKSPDKQVVGAMVDFYDWYFSRIEELARELSRGRELPANGWSPAVPPLLTPDSLGPKGIDLLYEVLRNRRGRAKYLGFRCLALYGEPSIGLLIDLIRDETNDSVLSEGMTALMDLGEASLVPMVSALEGGTEEYSRHVFDAISSKELNVIPEFGPKGQRFADKRLKEILADIEFLKVGQELSGIEPKHRPPTILPSIWVQEPGGRMRQMLPSAVLPQPPEPKTVWGKREASELKRLQATAKILAARVAK